MATVEMTVRIRFRRGAKFLYLLMNVPSAALFGRAWFCPDWLFVIEAPKKNG